ncbi:MAG: alpha/beta hydrolase-fold protein [Anaerolineae bacterium]|jgi:enterochelin esterase-like enzyme|nr:esterase [Chloroflexota bacterium]
MTTVPPLPLSSPQVHADGRVTFRLWAPQARCVSVCNTTGGYADWPCGNEVPLQRSEAGEWSVTLGPLAPEYYTYVYLVEGVATLDPGNTLTMRDGIRRGSSLRIPGALSSLYDIRAVPHGTVHQMWYPSPTLGMDRRMLVYTPPDYESGSQRYPVFYLLHGGGNDEEGWCDLGRAAQILDNLIAEGSALPMIVVMPNGNGTRPAAPDVVPVPPDYVRPAPGSHILRFADSLVPDLVPWVDAHLRTVPDRQQRAIAGLSMGGAQTLYVALNKVDTFAWIGAFSAGLPLLPGVAVEIPAPANAELLRGPDITRTIDPDRMAALLNEPGPALNDQLRQLHLTIGTLDGLITAHRALRGMLDDRSVRYTCTELEGYAHEWRFWRLALAAHLPTLFDR